MPSSRLARVQDPVVPVIGDLIKRTPGTISLGQGAVAFPPPPEALARLERSLTNPDTYRYGDAEGDAELLTLIRAKLARENRIATGDGPRDSRVMVTAGGNMAFLHAVVAVADPDDEIVLLAPYYFNHDMAIGLAGCRTIAVPTDERYRPRIDAVAAALTPKTRAVVSVSPNNPTGAVYRESELRAINDLCRDRGIYHISDEVYEYFTFDGIAHWSPGSADGTADHTISMFSLSKSYGLAGLRVGYLVYPAHLESAMTKSQDTIIVNAPMPAQYAAAAALAVGRAYTEHQIPTIEDARARLRAGADEIADVCSLPTLDGAFYGLLRVRTPLDAMTVTERLIREHRVAVLPGTAFGMSDGCYLRVAYGALDAESAQCGIERLVTGLREIAGGTRRARRGVAGGPGA
jgi:aspartate/methionine/tyrosine aminotransferase